MANHFKMEELRKLVKNYLNANITRNNVLLIVQKSLELKTGLFTISFAFTKAKTHKGDGVHQTNFFRSVFWSLQGIFLRCIRLASPSSISLFLFSWTFSNILL
jgi:hypothetical protein